MIPRLVRNSLGSKFPTPICLQGLNGCAKLCLNELFKFKKVGEGGTFII